MNGLNSEIKENSGFSDQKEEVRSYLEKLLTVSRDPDYDRYVRQMIRDLESGKASPFQVRREAERTFRLYQQRMGARGAPAGRDTVEFKVGAGIFSVIGAVFVLVAFMIFGLNFLDGIWQGVCLYVSALLVTGISLLFTKRLGRRFSLIIMGIGTGSLFLSTVINYLVLKTINEAAACVITLVISLFAVFVSRRRDSSFLRLICILGCYISFWPIESFESELSFLFMTGIFLFVNLVSVLLPNQKNRIVVDAVHMVLHPLFSVYTAVSAVGEGISPVYPACFVLTSAAVVNVIFLRHRRDVKAWFAALFSASVAITVITLAALTGFRHGNANEMQMLYYRLITEVMAVMAAMVFFILWEKEKYRWIQYYYIVAVVVLLNGFSYFRLEKAIGIITVFLLTRILSGKKRLGVLDCILTVLAVLEGIAASSYYCETSRYIVLFFAAFLLSVFFIRQNAVFHEIAVTVFFIFCILFEFDGNWVYLGCVGLLLVLFLLFNHLPNLKGFNQLPYNIVNLVFAGLFSLTVWFCFDSVISSVTMLTGAAAIVMMFRKRYGMTVPRKYLIAAGYLTYMILTAHYESPVIVSIFLMIISIGCVGAGFRLRDKVYRISGLSMAVCVCVKMIVYDFRGLDSLLRIILFFTVGVIALGISFLYIHLERKEEKEEKMAAIAQEIPAQDFVQIKDTEINKEGISEE